MNIQAKECIQRIHVYMHFNYLSMRGYSYYCFVKIILHEMVPLCVRT